MRLVIGIGNPGLAYLHTRHNAGFLVVDELQKTNLSKDVVIKKSDEFMNESGQFIKKLLVKYPGIHSQDIYVVHDDLDIKLGDFKITLGHGPKDHNGVKSVDDELGTDEYWHVRIGVDNRALDNKPMGIEYVLQDFTDEEREVLTSTIKIACKKLVTLFKNTK